MRLIHGEVTFGRPGEASGNGGPFGQEAGSQGWLDRQAGGAWYRQLGRSFGPVGSRQGALSELDRIRQAQSFRIGWSRK
eukprot:1120213-Heterocapsa_arctica.AAC.1